MMKKEKMKHKMSRLQHLTGKAIYSSFFFLFFSFAACNERDNVYRYAEGEIRLDVINDSLSILRHCLTDGREVSSFKLPYPTFRFCCGDLTGDGIPEIGVGVIKRTRFSPETDKRLFLFHLTDGRLIRPLWMGSHVGARLDDFRFGDDALIRTIEHNATDSLIYRTYKLSSFGLKPVSL
jgi:hypothetical protein